MKEKENCIEVTDFFKALDDFMEWAGSDNVELEELKKDEGRWSATFSKPSKSIKQIMAELFPDWAVEENNGLVTIYRSKSVGDVLSVSSYTFTAKGLEELDERGLMDVLKDYVELQVNRSIISPYIGKNVHLSLDICTSGC